MPGQITAFDIGECMVKAVCFTGGKLKKVMAKELPDNMVSGGEIVSMDAMADFLWQLAKENGLPRRAQAAVVLPAALMLCDWIIRHTTLKWMVPESANAKKSEKE